MNADELLGQALAQGEWARGVDVGAVSFPDAARTYLGDGTGLAWDLPQGLRRHGVFVVDAELVAPVRASFRRYGITDQEEFATAWTRAEVWAKLLDVPIITWVARYGLAEPSVVGNLRDAGRIAWSTRTENDMIVTFGARNPGVVGVGV